MFRYIIKRDLENPNFILLSYNELNQLHELKINVFESDKTVSPFVKGDDIEIKWESFDLLKNMFFEQHKNILLVDRDGEAVLGSSPQVINKLDIQNYAK